MGQPQSIINGTPTSRERQARQKDALRHLQTGTEWQADDRRRRDSAQQAFPHQARFDSQVPEWAAQHCSSQKGITLFQDNDRGFYGWMRIHPDAYFINIECNSKATFFVLHHSGCQHFICNSARSQAKNHIEFCSFDRRSLEGLALQITGYEAAICPACLT